MIATSCSPPAPSRRTHELPKGSLSNVDGDSDYVRVQVLTNAGALDRDKQIALVSRLTDLVATEGGDPASGNGPGCC
jgi:hypothetical protein